MICYSKLYLVIFFVLTSVLGVAQTSVWDGKRALWNDGTGTESDPYLIASADNLAFLAYMVNKGYETQGLFFRLVTNIDLNGVEGQSWEPIGLGDRLVNEDHCDRGTIDVGTSFRGHFDGGFHEISNIYVADGFTNAGLFGSVVGQENAPAVVENVFVASGTIVGNNSGGVIGNSSFATVSRCGNGAAVTGVSSGGIMGHATDAIINNCYNTGLVAGIVGDSGELPMVGGLVGMSQDNAQILNSYNTGEISTDDNAHCLVGYSMDGTLVIDNCHFLNSCGQSNYGTPQEEAFMRTIEFVDLLNSENTGLVWAFDLENTNAGFPILAENVYSISVGASPSEGGMVSGGGPLAQGTTCTLVAVANDRYVFENWVENGEVVSSDTVYAFAVAGNRSITGTFSLESYEITAAPSPLDAGVIIGEGNYLYGDTVTLIAIPNDNYVFHQWIENDAVVSDTATYVFLADHSCHVVADFTSCANATINSTFVEVFPNPVHDFLFVKGEGIRELTVFNTLGQVVCQVAMEGQEIAQISLKDYEAGTYIIEVKIGNRNSLIKVLKQ